MNNFNFHRIYPPKGLCEAEPEWGPFDILSNSLCLEKGVWHLQFTGGNSQKKNPENVLFDGMDRWEGILIEPFIFLHT